MDFSKIWEWVLSEASELKQAPGAAAAIAILFLFLGWLAAQQFYSERIAVLTLMAERQVSMPAPHPMATTSRAAVGAAIVLLVALAVSIGYRSTQKAENLDLARRVDALQEMRASELEQIQSLTQQRDRACAELKDRKYQYAMDTLERYANAKFRDGVQPRVTIRFAQYSTDHELAEKIQGFFTQYVKWPVSLDASNKPALPRADEFKVVFDVGMTYFTYGSLVHAFAEGDLLGVRIGQRQFVDREDSEHLVVLVLPSVGSEPIRAEPA